MTLSVCLIVKNENDVLARALTCAAKFADETVVCDTGSDDGSEEIARRFTDRVYSFEWCDDFSAARNFCFSKAGCDLVMWLDADDFITDENCEKILRLKERMAGYDMAFMPYAAAFDEDGTPVTTYLRERVFLRSGNFRWVGAVHEVIPPRGKIYYSDAVIYHKKQHPGDPVRNLRIYQKQISGGRKLDGREKFYYARELFYNGMYTESAAVLKEFVFGDGWKENKIEACRTLYKISLARGDESAALNWLLKAFTFAPPRSEDCCGIADFFMRRNDFKSAIYWYMCAVNAEDETCTGAFVNADFKAFIPYMQLCVAYDRLGDAVTASRYNDMAGEIKPHSKNYISNKRYFENKLKGK